MNNLIFIGGLPPATVDFLQATVEPNNNSVFTFSGQNFGTENAARYIIVGYAIVGTGSTPSVTIGGVSATLAVSVIQGSSNATGLAIAAVPTGTSGSVVVTLGGGTAANCSICVYSTTTLQNATAFNTTTSTSTDPSVTLDIPAKGFAIGIGESNSNTASPTWSGLTERSENIVESNTVTSASDNFLAAETARAISITYSGSANGSACFASWA